MYRLSLKYFCGFVLWLSFGQEDLWRRMIYACLYISWKHGRNRKRTEKKENIYTNNNKLYDMNVITLLVNNSHERLMSSVSTKYLIVFVTFLFIHNFFGYFFLINAISQKLVDGFSFIVYKDYRYKVGLYLLILVLMLLLPVVDFLYVSIIQMWFCPPKISNTIWNKTWNFQRL